MKTKFQQEEAMRFIDIYLFIWPGLAGGLLLFPAQSHAFSKLINGLETITATYLTPLATAVAGASFLLYVTLSYFKQDEYQRKVVNILILSVFTGAGLEMIKLIIQNFS